MSREKEIFERAISEAYSRQVTPEPASNQQARNQIVQRGRRRRAERAFGAVFLVAAIATGASASINVLRDDQPLERKEDKDRLEVVDETPALGVERIMEFGGPIAVWDDTLIVANMNTESRGRSSFARFDLATEELTNTEPSIMIWPGNAAAGPSGLWVVGWTGSTGDDGDAHGRIQLANSVTGELLVDLRRDKSAPSDVAVSFADGLERVWVVDALRHQLLEVDPASGDEIRAIEVEEYPYTVTVGEGSVWVASGGLKKQGAVTRYDLESDSIKAFPLDHSAYDLVVHDTSVWIADWWNGTVHRLDSTTGEELASVDVGGRPSSITAGGGFIWVDVGGNRVVRVDPSVSEVVGDPIKVRTEGSTHHGGMVVADDSLFVSTVMGVFRVGEDVPVGEPSPEG